MYIAQKGAFLHIERARLPLTSKIQSKRASIKPNIAIYIASPSNNQNKMTEISNKEHYIDFSLRMDAYPTSYQKIKSVTTLSKHEQSR